MGNADIKGEIIKKFVKIMDEYSLTGEEKFETAAALIFLYAEILGMDDDSLYRFFEQMTLGRHSIRKNIDKIIEENEENGKRTRR